METCTKLGYRIYGRVAELYLGMCPPERPCTKEQVEKYRVYLDSLPPTLPLEPDQPIVVTND